MKFSKIMEDYVLAPSAQKLKALQKAILEDSTYDPMVQIGSLIGGGATSASSFSEFSSVRVRSAQSTVDVIGSHMPGLFLSPQAHARLAQAYEVLGRVDDVVREQKLAAIALDSIRQSGTGAHGAPYEVLRVQDEYDILSASGLRPTDQAQQEDNDGVFDVLTVEDGSTFWFRLLWRVPSQD